MEAFLDERIAAYEAKHGELSKLSGTARLWFRALLGSALRMDPTDFEITSEHGELEDDEDPTNQCFCEWIQEL